MMTDNRMSMGLWQRMLAALLVFCGAALGSDRLSAAEFPNDIWQQIPVYHHGRVKPMDAYARSVTQKVTEFNKSSPKFNLNDYFTKEELAKSEMADALEIFPEGEQRKFTAGQLVFDWLTRPEKWHRVPFIYLGREDVRKELGFPVEGPTGAKLNFVSPHDILTSVELRKYLSEMNQRRMNARMSGGEFQETAMDVRIWSELLFRYAVFREISLDPRGPVIGSEPLPMQGSRDRLMSQVIEASTVLGDPNSPERTLLSQLEALQQIGANHALGGGATELLQSYRNLRSLAAAAWVDVETSLANEDAEPIMPDEPPTPEELEPVIVRFREAASNLADTLEEQRNEVNNRTNLSEQEYNNIKPLFQSMLVKVRQLAHIGLEIHLGLYENSNVGARFASTSMDRAGNALQVVPAINSYALSSSRDPSDLSQPWLGLSTVLYGSPQLLEPYDQQLIRAVRSAWQNTTQAYLAGEEMREPMQNLADSLQRLGDRNTAQRVDVIEEELGEDEKDSGILAYTAYPPSDSYRMATEVRYNTMDPFMYAWIFTFIATLGFALAFAVLRKPMFWIGVAFLTFGILWSTYGFYMRVVVTGWAPVTNMYETVIFVPWVVCVLGVLFLLLPIYDRGRLAAWRATAFLWTWEEAELSESQLEMFSSPTIWKVFTIVSSVLRIPMTLAVAYTMTFLTLYDGNRPIVNFDSLAFGPNTYQLIQDSIVSVILIGTVVLSAWYLPRLLLSGILLTLFCIYDWFAIDQRFGDRIAKSYERNYYGLAAAASGTFLLCVASIAPIVDTGSSRVLNTEFSPLQPVLRSNVWLTIHVLTIVASYGAGILAWGLGWLALGYYMFGRYRPPVVASTLNQGLAPAHGHSPQMSYRPPEECFTLGGHVYRAIQVAVLLLATGTILGGIWADVSWGRFWGWDPKEVWALVTLLIYVAILHARFAGWFNNFGMVVGTVIGFSAIVGSWYGVNFLLPLFKGGEAVGLHSYGSGGKGSEIMVIGFVAANWVALGIVALRFHLSKLSVVDENEVEEVVIKTDVPESEESGELADAT